MRIVPDFGQLALDGRVCCAIQLISLRNIAIRAKTHATKERLGCSATAIAKSGSKTVILFLCANNVVSFRQALTAGVKSRSTKFVKQLSRSFIVMIDCKE